MFKRLLLLLAIGAAIFAVSKPTAKKETIQDDKDYDFSQYYLDCRN